MSKDLGKKPEKTISVPTSLEYSGLPSFTKVPESTGDWMKDTWSRNSGVDIIRPGFEK